MMAAIISGDEALVKELIEKGSSINEKNMSDKVEFDGDTFYFDVPPLEFAFSCRQYKIVKLLVDYGADMPVDNSPLIRAIRHNRPDIFNYMVEHGAVLGKAERSVNQLLSNLSDCWNDSYIRGIEMLGLPIKKYGGEGLFYAAEENQTGMVKWLLSVGVDINARKNFNKETPLYGAVANNHFEMVKLLAEHGADVTITDNYGVRPYTVAKRNRNMEMAEYIKSLEPEELHSEAAHAKLLSSYNMPLEMEEYLKNGNLYLEFPDDSHIEWIKLNEYTDVCEMTFKKKKVLSIVENSSDGDIILVWEPKNQSIYFVDLETNSMRKVGSWETFIKNPIKCLNRVIVWAKPL